jgi:hypothetical protein
MQSRGHVLQIQFLHLCVAHYEAYGPCRNISVMLQNEIGEQFCSNIAKFCIFLPVGS